MGKQSPTSSEQQRERRSFLASLNAGAAASLAALAVGGSALAQEKPAGTSRFEPARHDKDNWLDELPGKHRLIFDTSSPDGVGDAILFAGNFLRVNKAEYGIEENDIAVIIVLRHRSTPFGYKDSMWAKYPAGLTGHAAPFEDPKTKEPPKVNIYNSADYGRLLSSRGATLESLTKRGVHLAICASATRGTAGEIAQMTGGNANEINAELIANILPNGRMVPAGIVAVSRAQERGYTLVKT
jgi:intracellular sulfur oxidation DsrE/DsrF family protein